MKKLTTIMLALCMLLTLGVGISVSADDELTTSSTELTLAAGTQVETLDYLITAKTSDHEINSNLVDGLLEADQYGHLVPCLAESWEHNDDNTVWTFHIRPDVKWMTSDGEEYADVVADDWVAGMRHGAEFDSETGYLLMDVIAGYTEYLNSDFSDEEFEKVGVKALDDSTLEYTLTKPVPYFDTMTTYAVLYPVNRQFLESKGEGCVLGSPDKEKCEFGALKFDAILYNGPYFLTVNDPKSKIEWTKNEDYWDADHVFMEKVTYIYDDGQDPYSVIKGFEQGVYPQAALNPGWEDYDKYLEKYKDNAYFTLPNATTFGLIFNFNRQTFNETNYAEDEALRENTRKAVLNENFRKAVRAAYDKVAYLAVSTPQELAQSTVRQIDNFPGAGTTSDGKMYFDLVTETYNEMTGEDRDLHDGIDTFLSKDEALAFIEKAKEEGIEFPVHLDMLVYETSDRLVKQAQSMKKSISDNTDGQIIIELVLRDPDTVTAIAYRNTDPAKMDFDISTFTGWGPDFGDPKTYVDIWSATTGYEMASAGLGNTEKKAAEEGEEAEDGEEVILDLDIKEQVGLMEYEELYRAADAITDDMDARYKAFAKADAKLIEKCFYIPTSMQSRGQVVSKYVPFSGIFSDYGITQLKFKNIRLQDEIVTVEQREEAYEDWMSKR